jgi:putative flippase GtrA
MSVWTGEALRFAAVGLFQNGLNVAVFALASTLGVQYRAAAVIAGLVAFVVSFLLNRRWTFTGRATPAGPQGVRYLLVFAAAVALGVGLLTLFVELTGMPNVAAQVAAIVIVAPLSFLAQRAWVFRRPPSSTQPVAPHR